MKLEVKQLMVKIAMKIKMTMTMMLTMMMTTTIVWFDAGCGRKSLTSEVVLCLPDGLWSGIVMTPPVESVRHA